MVVHPAHPWLSPKPPSGTARTADDPALGQALAALTDPTRRAVQTLLARGPQRAGELAAALAMSPPSLSRHLRVLRHSGLITDDEPDHDARVRLYRLRPAALVPLQGWLDALQAFWGDQLLAFKAHAGVLPPRTSIAGDQARASAGLALPPAAAFAIFSGQVDQWRRRGRRFRNTLGGSGIVRMLGLWWGDQLTALRLLALASPPTRR